MIWGELVFIFFFGLFAGAVCLRLFFIPPFCAEKGCFVLFWGFVAGGDGLLGVGFKNNIR